MYDTGQIKLYMDNPVASQTVLYTLGSFIGAVLRHTEWPFTSPQIALTTILLLETIIKIDVANLMTHGF